MTDLGRGRPSGLYAPHAVTVRPCLKKLLPKGGTNSPLARPRQCGNNLRKNVIMFSGTRRKLSRAPRGSTWLSRPAGFKALTRCSCLSWRRSVPRGCMRPGMSFLRRRQRTLPVCDRESDFDRPRTVRLGAVRASSDLVFVCWPRCPIEATVNLDGSPIEPRSVHRGCPRVGAAQPSAA